MSDAQPTAEKPATPRDEDPASSEALSQSESNRRRWTKVGFGAAIGSAAIAAALLYANRSGRNERS